MDQFYQVTEYRSNIYRITSKEGVIMDLLVGREKALLIDTGYGFGNLRATVEGITQLPLTVVNTHGHFDHTDGNYQFSDCDIYLNPNDVPVYKKYSTPEERAKAVERGRHTLLSWGSSETMDILPEGFQEDAYINAPKVDTLPLQEGMHFDLGGIELTAYEVPGHTWGSIALLNSATGDLYIGDAANAFVLVCLDGADMSTYRRTLQKLKEMKFQQFLQGHLLPPVPKAALDDYLDCAKCVGKVPYEDDPSPFEPGRINRLYRRPGYSGADMGKAGYAQIETSEANMK